MQLNIRSICFTHPQSPSPALDKVSATLNEGWTGLVGDNGCGKTTLAKIACGCLEADAGSITPKLSALYCEQDASIAPCNLEDFAYAYDSEAIRLRSMLEVDDEWAWRYETLSCGQQKRLQIACALWAAPALLAVDEPTNHVDSRTRATIAAALKQHSGIGILISHDRSLLDELCTQCIFLSRGGAVTRPGTYTQAAEQAQLERKSAQCEREKAKREVSRLSAEAQQRSEQAAKTASRRSARNVAKHDSDARERIRLAVYSGQDGKAGKLSARMDSRLEKANEKLGSLHVEKRYEEGLWADITPSRRNDVLKTKALTLSLGSEQKLEIPSLYIGNTDHIGITAPNGWGKTTLVQQLVTVVPSGVSLLYIPQEPSEQQHAAVMEELTSLNSEQRGRVLSVVARLNSDPARILEGTTVSPGELRKLMLGLGILHNPELIVMDEPTNHLDLGSIHALERFLTTYPGALLLVSHDPTLLRTTTQRTWAIERIDKEHLKLTER